MKHLKSISLPMPAAEPITFAYKVELYLRPLVILASFNPSSLLWWASKLSL